MSPRRIARIITGVILLALFAGYTFKHDQNWVHSDDVAAIAEASRQSVVEYMANLEKIGNSDSDSSESEAATEPTPEVTQEAAESSPEPAAENSAESSAEVNTTRADGLPDIDTGSWEFLLANSEHNIQEYVPETSEIEGQQMDTRVIEPLTEFVAAAREAGVPVYLSSGYRDYATQSYLYQRKISQGYTPEVAATIVAVPGTSEHQTGLAMDITDYYRETKDSSLESTETYQWLSAHCQEYGFIVRYPNDKSDVTGIIYEPWHFRFVGVEAATYIMEHDLCLEEFLTMYE